MDLKEEVRNGYTVSAQMKQAWGIQLIMLKGAAKHPSPFYPFMA